MDLPQIHPASSMDKTNGDPEKGDTHLEVKRHSHRRAVIRIEVHDTGPGLRKKDVVECVQSPASFDKAYRSLV